MSDHVDDHIADLVAAGLFDPDGPEAASQLELLVYLLDDVGASIPEIVQANERGGLLSFAAFRSLRAGRDHLTLAEAAGHAGMAVEVALQIWRGAGFVDPRPYERRFGEDDVELFRLCGVLAGLVGSDAVLHLMRTAGEAMGRVAEAEVALLRSNVEAPLVRSRQLGDVARAYVEVVNNVLPSIAAALDTVHRHHLQAIGRRYSDVGAPTSALNVVELAVGFADLAGYTGMWQELSTQEIAVMLTLFETITGDVIAAAGANVAKRIGDAVMFVTNAPGVACALSLGLLEACAAAKLPKLRVGVAFGAVMVRHGDFYGEAVNLAARLVAEAAAGTALSDKALHDRLARVRGGYTFAPVGKLTLAGFQEPVEAFQLLRP